MSSDKRRNGRLQATQERARVSPVRSLILDRLEGDHSRTIDPQQLLEELNCGGWRISLAQINYHLHWLAEAELIPAPCLDG